MLEKGLKCPKSYQENGVDRIMTKKRIGAILAGSFVWAASFLPVQSYASSNLVDIQGHWAQNQISSWVEKDLAKGYEDHSFRPNNTITRAEFITLVNRYFGFIDVSSVSFSDVKSGDWYADEVS